MVKCTAKKGNSINIVWLYLFDSAVSFNLQIVIAIIPVKADEMCQVVVFILFIIEHGIYYKTIHT